MSENLPPVPGDMSGGGLGRAANFLAGILIISVMMIITMVPSYLLMMLLDPDHPASVINALAVAAAVALLGPAISAGMYAFRGQTIDDEPRPFRAFWRGYRRNFFDVLRIWFPTSLILGFIFLAMGVANVTGMGLGNIGLLALALVVVLYGFHALAIATFINMTTGGIARLALLYLGRTWKVTLGVVALILIMVLLTNMPGGIFFVGVLAGVLVFLLYQNYRPMILDVTEHYTVSSAAPHDTIE